MTPLVGTSLKNGKYLLKKEIGRGIAGISYKATNKVLNEQVVIKTLNLALAHKSYLAELRKKFLNEARRLVRCSHPNIITFREFFVEDGLPYLVMDYIPGQSLEKIVLPSNPLPEAIAIDYIRQVGEALKVVHQNGLLHRDVKPQNLILRQGTQQVVLIDFGIAREFTPGSTQTHTQVTTDGYAPIEQYLPKAKRTPASDIYSLSATLYTLLTAQIPVTATLRNRLPFPSPVELRPGLSPQVSEAVMRGMEIEQKNRPTNVDEWLALLPATKLNRRSVEAVSSIPGMTPQAHPSQVSSSNNQHSKLNQSDKHKGLLKKVIAGVVLLLALDYVWLKYQASFKDSPTQPNNVESSVDQ